MSEPNPTPMLRRRVLRDDVHEILLDRLLSGVYQDGQTLAIDSLARELGVSPTPVREALAWMEHTGLVTRAALKGYRVAPPLSAAAMSELMHARMLLETDAVRGSAGRLDALLPALGAAHAHHLEVVAGLQLDDPDPATRMADVREHFAADWAFHQTILDHCGNRYVDQLVNSLAPRIHRQRQSLGHGLTDVQLALAEHAQVLDKYRNGTIEDAVTAMRVQLEGVCERAVRDSQ